MILIESEYISLEIKGIRCEFAWELQQVLVLVRIDAKDIKVGFFIMPAYEK